ncbi:MAG: FAD-binding protein [Pleurocapsa minor GSE-CHR-MK-17-07R]|nr:FAD-binding protein [Pleurocapsa minor GSE-CHR-MK 17-07R]
MNTHPSLSHIIVIGGSMAGLLAARVASQFAAQVTLMERDHLPPDGRFRPGTPQARHVHGLLARGLNILNDLFPGFDADLDAAGIARVEWMWDTMQHVPTGWTPRYHSGIVSRPITRPLLEHLVRTRIRAIPNIRLRDGLEVTGLLLEDGRVHGVTMQSRPRSAGAPESLRADLVIDASGRASKSSEWLAEAGYGAPNETLIDAHMGYGTREYAMETRPPFDALLALPRPDDPRGGVLTVVEDGRWLMTLAGYGEEHHPPTDGDAFDAYARALPLEPLQNALAHARPVGPVYGYHRTANIFRHYERARLPAGFIVTGDAVCAFNPVYGQGMTASAIAAETLHHTLLRHDARDPAFPANFQPALARAVADAWLMATSEDLRYEHAIGGPANLKTRVQHGALDILFQAVPVSPKVSKALLETLHMLRSPLGLFTPDVLAAFGVGMLKRLARPPQANDAVEAGGGDDIATRVEGGL